MRRLPINRRRVGSAASLCLVLAALLVAEPLAAQGAISTSGALELVLPVGARANALGQAVVADYLGSESVWWNPAAMARATQREIAIHHSQTYAATGDAITGVLPIAGVGTLALSVDLYNYGTQDITDATGTYGTFTPLATILAATFAGHAGSRAYLGLNYKFYQRGINCSGGCAGVATQNETTTAIDLGLQVRVSTDSSLFVGAAIRNIGPKLQVNDAPQADPLPARVDLGVTWMPRVPSLGPDADLSLSAGVVNAVPAAGLGLRAGADLAWQHKVHVRAGYVHAGPLGSGPTIGVGAATGRLELDIARLFSDAQANTSQPPTYFSLRVLF
jgi:hypothetical protein